MGATIEIPQDTQNLLHFLKIPYLSSLSTVPYTFALTTHHQIIHHTTQDVELLSEIDEMDHLGQDVSEETCLNELSEMEAKRDALESFKVSAPKLLENYVQANTKIRDYSSKLKEIEESTKNMTITDQEFEQIKKEISDLQDKIDSLTEECEHLRSSLAQVESADREIVDIKKTLQELFKINKNKEKRMDTDVQELKTQYHEQQQTIKILNTKVDSFSSQQHDLHQIFERMVNNQSRSKLKQKKFKIFVKI